MILIATHSIYYSKSVKVLNNCSCTAYASGAGCSLWYEDMVNIIARGDGMSGVVMHCTSVSRSPIL
jgi:PAN-like domain